MASASTANSSLGEVALHFSEAIEANPPYLLARGASSTHGWPTISIRPASIADGVFCEIKPDLAAAGKRYAGCPDYNHDRGVAWLEAPRLSIDMVYSPYNL